MSTPERLRRALKCGLGAALAAALTAGAADSGAQAGPMLGVPITADQPIILAASIMIDGTRLPPGSGDAGAGAEVYRQHCLACHGEGGAGGPNDVLVGGVGTLHDTAPLRTVGSYWPYATTIFDYIRRAMPYPTPGVLSDAEAYAVTAYLLHRNGIIGASDRIDAQTLPAVVMPNRAGFVPSDEVPSNGEALPFNGEAVP